MRKKRVVKFNNPLIYLITEGNLTEENYKQEKAKILDIIRLSVEAEISHIQIREKKIPAKLVFELASQAAQITKNTGTKLLINDRADIALAAKADGIHLTENSLSAEIVRGTFPKNFVIGVSTHSLETAENAKQQKADFVTFSPIFSSPGKGEPKGLDGLREVCERLKDFPVIALGGIDENNYREVLQAGARGFAAIRFLNDPENIKKIRKEFFTK